MKKLILFLIVFLISINESYSQDKQPKMRVTRIKLKDASLNESELNEKIIKYKRQIQDESQNYAVKLWLLNCYVYADLLDTAYNYSNDILQLANIEYKDEYPSFLAFRAYYYLINGNKESAKENFEILINYYNNKLKEDSTDIEYNTNLAFFKYLSTGEKDVLKKFKESIDSERSMAKDLELFFTELELLNEEQLLEKIKSFKHQLPYNDLDFCNTSEVMRRSIKEYAELDKYKEYDFLAHNYKFLDSNFQIIMTNEEYDFYMNKYDLYPSLRNYSDSLIIPLAAEFDNNSSVVRIAQNRLTMNWFKLGRYLWLSETETEVLGKKYKFTHPYKLYEYCGRNDETQWDKDMKDFMKILQNRVYNHTKNSAIYTMPNKTFLSFALQNNPF